MSKIKRIDVNKKVPELPAQNFPVLVQQVLINRIERLYICVNAATGNFGDEQTWERTVELDKQYDNLIIKLNWEQRSIIADVWLALMEVREEVFEPVELDIAISSMKRQSLLKTKREREFGLIFRI